MTSNILHGQQEHFWTSKFSSGLHCQSIDINLIKHLKKILNEKRKKSKMPTYEAQYGKIVRRLANALHPTSVQNW